MFPLESAFLVKAIIKSIIEIAQGIPVQKSARYNKPIYFFLQ